MMKDSEEQRVCFRQVDEENVDNQDEEKNRKRKSHESLSSKGPCIRRIYFPRLGNGDYNFTGLIIGPRGKTKKRIEVETQCKISVRGKGTRSQIDGDMELHCYVEGDSEERVEIATTMIQELIQNAVEDRQTNQNKQSQLHILSTINHGPLKTPEDCLSCQGNNRNSCICSSSSKGFPSCLLCGSLHHFTQVCPRGMRREAAAAIDQEYSSFLAELEAYSSSQQPLSQFHSQPQSHSQDQKQEENPP